MRERTRNSLNIKRGTGLDAARALGLGPSLGCWVAPLQGLLSGLPLAVGRVPRQGLPLEPLLVASVEQSLVEL